MSFSNLKKQSSLGSLTAKLVSQVEKMNKGSNGVDDRLWKPEVDKAGNGYAVIRFLPAPDGEDLLGQNFILMLSNIWWLVY